VQQQLKGHLAHVDCSAHCSVQEQQQAASAPTKVPLTAAEWERLDGLARRMAAGAKIAGAAADVAAPLLLSADLKVGWWHVLH
jgi:hypothetical protein